MKESRTKKVTLKDINPVVIKEWFISCYTGATSVYELDHFFDKYKPAEQLEGNL